MITTKCFLGKLEKYIFFNFRFHSFLKGETNIPADDAFTKAIQSYYETFLKSERVQKVVHAGGFSQHDFREVSIFCCLSFTRPFYWSLIFERFNPIFFIINFVFPFLVNVCNRNSFWTIFRYFGATSRNESAPCPTSKVFRRRRCSTRGSPNSTQ